MSVFVTGTDTGVGKTLCATLLMSALEKADAGAKYWKPVQTGDDDDTETVQRLSGAQAFPPRYRFALPAAPSRAAEQEGARIEVGELARAWRELSNHTCVVEGAGGLLVPLNESETQRDLIRALGLPILLVASTRLGTINHTLLTLESARASGIPILGVVLSVVLSGQEDPGLENTLELFGARILGRIPWLGIVSRESVAASAAQVFPPALLQGVTGTLPL